MSHHSFEKKVRVTTPATKSTAGPANLHLRRVAAAVTPENTTEKRTASPSMEHVSGVIKVILDKSEDMGEVTLNIVPGKTTGSSFSVRALRVSVDKPTAKPVWTRTAACSGERRLTRRVKGLPLGGEHHDLRLLMCGVR